MHIPKLFLLCAFLTYSFNALHAQSTELGSIQHDGLTRNFRLYLPPGYSASAQVPLVLNMHGFTSNAFEQQFYSEMGLVADTAGFLVCYPDGVGAAWNVGWDFGSTADDVGFLSKLIDTLAANYGIDIQRVYACGMSNGGFMSYRLACELNDKIAAVASVTGGMAPAYQPMCNPGRAVPVMQVHGTADDVVFYDGTPDVSIPVEDLIDFWVANNECNPEGDTMAITDINATDSSTAQRIDFFGQEAENRVAFFKVFGGGHTWPGASIPIGITNQDFEASVEVWRFFRQYSLDEAVSVGEEPNHNDFVLFPNPSNGWLRMNTAERGRYQVHDATGRILATGELRHLVQGQWLGHLSAGIYTVVIFSSRGERISRRWVVR